MNKNLKIFILCIILLVSVVGVILLLLSKDNPVSEPNKSVEDSNSKVVSEVNIAPPVAHEDLLNIFVQGENSTDIPEVLRKIREYPIKQKMETIAYCLKENKYTYLAIQSIYEDPSLQNVHLAPYLAETIQKSEGHTLFVATRIAKGMPDLIFLKPLIEHALENDYLTGNPIARTYNSVFADAAEAIYKITGGKIGIEKIQRNREIPKEERKAMIQKWRKIYDESLKQEYEKKF